MTKGLCVLIHGFTGSPDELGPLKDALVHNGYDVEVPVLSGHCASRDNLESATASAWIDSVRPYVRDGISQGPVHLVGFSMGAMIAAVLAAEYPVASITMLAPAVFYVGTKQLFRTIAGTIKETWDASSRTKSVAVLRQRIESVSETPLKCVRQFRRVVQMGKSALLKLDVPLCVIQGEQDEVVEPRGATYVMQVVHAREKQLHVLPETGHMVCLGPDSNRVNDIVCQFISVHPTHEFPSPSADSAHG